MQITYSTKFEKQYRKLSNVIKNSAEEKETIFKKNPFDMRLKTHKLSGKFKEYLAFSVNNSYRIIFTFEDSEHVRFHNIGNHDIYD